MTGSQRQRVCAVRLAGGRTLPAGKRIGRILPDRFVRIDRLIAFLWRLPGQQEIQRASGADKLTGEPQPLSNRRSVSWLQIIDAPLHLVEEPLDGHGVRPLLSDLQQLLSALSDGLLGTVTVFLAVPRSEPGNKTEMVARPTAAIISRHKREGRSVSVHDDLEEYRNEVDITAWSYYAWKNIRQAAASSEDNVRALNANSWFWNISLHSLQVTFFVALGRIFDNDKRSLGADTFIKKCKANIGEFTKSALEARRLAQSGGTRPDYLTSYIAGAYEADIADFDALRAKVKTYHALYEAKYQPIRHKFMAHKDYASINLKESFFANTSVEEIEDIIRFVDGVREFVFQLHQNGRLIDVDKHKPDLESHVAKDANDLLARLASTIPAAGL